MQEQSLAKKLLVLLVWFGFGLLLCCGAPREVVWCVVTGTAAACVARVFAVLVPLVRCLTVVLDVMGWVKILVLFLD